MAAAGVDPRSTLASLGSGQWQLLVNLHRYYAAGETPQRALQHPIPFPVGHLPAHVPVQPKLSQDAREGSGSLR
jgi:hypothetical protein